MCKLLYPSLYVPLKLELHLFPTMSLIFILTTIFLCSPFVSANDERYQNCSAKFDCGNITNIGYPFWRSDQPDYCGHPKFWLNCTDEAALITIQNLTYQVLEIDSDTHNLKLAREDYIGDICPDLLINTTLDSFFNYASDVQDITLYYGCPLLSNPYSRVTGFSNQFNCTLNSTEQRGFYVTSAVDLENFNSTISSLLSLCENRVIVPATQSAIAPVERSPTEENLVMALEQGFGLQWNVNNAVCETCNLSDGRCGYNTTTSSFVCYCADQPEQFSCRESAANQPESSGPAGKYNKVVLGIGLAIAAITVLTIFLGWYYCFRRRGFWSGKALTLQRKNKTQAQNIETFIMNYHRLMPRRYSYSEIKKMTKSFTDKLGEGGFGGVYKGKSPDGRFVAVKVLNKSMGDGEEFINEVASISRTSHVNIVILLGFCYERDKKALVYEYMSNGSLDKFIYNQRSEQRNCCLDWKTLYGIAIGVARGLEYLHCGCNSRIVHFDIKPQNVLLDDDFCPKISDFGLAKLCKGKESKVSILGAKGTAGYIAPEVFMRSYGRVSYKSDVYSYGMMILELFEGKDDINVGEASQSSEMYFPDWIYKKLELGHTCSLQESMTVEEGETVRRMVITGLWCIQTNPSDRPSMTRVIEMLEGNLQSLQIPPKPVLFSPIIPSDYSAVSSTTYEQ